MNKNVWLWWEQGWNQAPEICKMTVKSFEKSSPDWKIHCLSKDNLWEYISKDYKWIMSCQGPAFRGDLVRAILLKEYAASSVGSTVPVVVKLYRPTATLDAD